MQTPYLAVRLIVMTAAALASAAALRAADDDKHVARARELLALFVQGKHEQFAAAGVEQMKQAFKPEQSAAVLAQLEFQAGKYVREKGAERTQKAEYQSVLMTLEFERADVKLEFVLTEDGKLAGLWNRGIAERGEPKLPPYADPAKYREEPIVVRCGQYELPGTLTLPKDAKRPPAIVLVHGSGPHDQDETVAANKPFRDLAAGLASRGVAVLRYEKRTHKYGAAMAATDITLEAEVIDDAVAAAELLRKRDDVDARRIYVLGHSLGGTLAPYIARRADWLGGIVILAGAARSIVEVVPEQIEYLARLDGALSAEESAQLESVRKSAALIHAGKLDEVKEPLLGAPSAYWALLDKLDPAGVAAELTMRILVLHGGRDYQVTRKCFDIWQKRLAERKNVEFRVFERLNHLMLSGESPSTPQEYATAGFVDIAVIEAIREWSTK